MTPTTATTRSGPAAPRSSGTDRGAAGAGGPRLTARGAQRGPSRVGGRRRRRSLVTLVVLIIAAVVVVGTMPLARRAVRELGLPLRYSAVIRRQAAEKRLDPALVAAVIYAETKFDPRTSPAGAEGLMQVEPRTAAFLARRSGATTFTTADLASPTVNIAYGSYYLRYLLDEYHGSRVLALAAYNGGETNVDRWEAAARSHGHDLRVAEIPFPETRNYVRRVLHAQRAYRRAYPHQLGYS